MKIIGPTALSIAASFLVLASVGGWAAFQPRRVDAAKVGNERQPVLVELFTSEGCSSCPPADELLARLDAMQFVPEAQAIVLSEHVTYWNRLGWRDPFSLETMTERQQRYAQQFGLDEVYTPQMVVDGAAELVGSDRGALERDVARAAEAAKVQLTIDRAERDGAGVHFAVHGGANVPAGARLLAALAEDSAQSQVARGENSGRTLRHVAVVRVLQEMDAGAWDGRELQLKPIDERGGSERLRLVVFLKDARSGRVLGVAERLVS